MTRILFVCLGNICRSPLMEGVARAHWDGAGVEFDSAGLGPWHAGSPPDPRAIAVAARHGIDIGGQRARQVQAGDFTGFDWLLCADREVLAALRRRAPAGARGRVALYLEWCGGPATADAQASADAAGGGMPEAADVPDPYTGGEKDFAEVFALVADATRALVQRLRTGR